MAVNLKKAYKQAWSMNKDSVGASYIGSIERENNRVIQLYKGSSGKYWYKTMYKTPYGLITEDEFIFGKGKKSSKKRY